MNSFGKSLLALTGICLMTSAAHADNGGKQPVKSSVSIGAPPARMDAKYLRDLPAPSRDEIQTLAAPALTYLQVSFVYSTNYEAQYPSTDGFEPVAGVQSMTTGDHGGAELYVVTDEFGYGSNPVATWNGGQVSLSKNVAEDTICVNWARTGYDIPCKAGQTIVG